MSINEGYLLRHNITEEQYIARVYNQCLDCVMLINRIVSGEIQTTDPADDIARNVEYLQHVLTWEYWTDEDMTPFTDAITAGQNYIDSLPQ